MRVFVTGASGHIGSLVVSELLDAGHEVTGLARSDRSATALAAAGAKVHRGSLDDLGGLRAGAAAADGVIHLAFMHDFGNYEAAATTDLRAVETMGAALAASGRPFVITSGTLMLALAGLGRLGTEADVLDTGAPPRPRVASENTAIALAESGVRSAAIRLAPSVHGPADAHGFVPSLIGIARGKGVSAYVGDGSSRWPAVHELDAARLYRLALEAAPAGSRLHGVGDEGIPFRDIAEAIGRRLKLPAVSIEPGQAAAHFGFLGTFVQLDNPTSSAATQQLLGWRPVRPGLIEDLEHGRYFDGADQRLQGHVEHHRGAGAAAAAGRAGGQGQVVARAQPGRDDRAGHVVAGWREHGHRPRAGRADQPQFVATRGGQRVQVRGGEHQGVPGVGHHDRHRAAAGHRAGHHGRVPRGQHRGDLLAAGLDLAELVPRAAVADPEHDRSRDGGRGRHRARGQGQAGAETAGETAPRPGADGRLGLRGGRPLPGRGGRRQHPLLQAGRRRDRGRAGQPGGGLAQAGDLVRALPAAGQVALEPGPVRHGDRVHRVRARERMDLPVAVHCATPKQSRSRISASRILVLIVPGGTPSRLATCP